MMHYLRLLWLFVRVGIQDDAAYRANFIAHLVVTFLAFAAELIGLWTIFSNTTSLGGWNAYEILAMLGVFRAMHGIIGLFISPNMRRNMEEIRDGRLDYMVIKPLNTQFYASFRRIVVWRLTDIAMGLILVGIACGHPSATLTVGRLANFIVMLAAGVVIIYSFWLILSTCAFWFTRINNIEMVFWNVFEAGRYPVDIYSHPVRLGLTYIVPLAFIVTFPAGALMGKAHVPGAGFAVVAAVVSFWAASAFWRYGLRCYSGASA